MTNELICLTWVTALTAVIWMPYVVNLILVRGLIDAVGYPDDPKPISAWATRMKAAHSNAVENLVVFAALVLIASAASISNEMTETACEVYFWARLVHFAAYTVRIPWVRTFAFLTGFGAQVVLIWQILG